MCWVVVPPAWCDEISLFWNFCCCPWNVLCCGRALPSWWSKMFFIAIQILLIRTIVSGLFFGRFSEFGQMSASRETWVLELSIWVFQLKTWVFQQFHGKNEQIQVTFAFLVGLLFENPEKSEFWENFDLSFGKNLSFLGTWVFVKTSKKKPALCRS